MEAIVAMLAAEAFGELRKGEGTCECLMVVDRRATILPVTTIGGAVGGRLDVDSAKYKKL